MKQSSREEFYRDMKEYFDAGVLNEIISRDYFSICNAANSGYLAFPYMKSKDGYQAVLSVNSKFLKDLLKDESLLHRLIGTASNQFLQKYFGVADKNLLNKLINTKKMTDIQGPTNMVDLEFERSLGSRKVK